MKLTWIKKWHWIVIFILFFFILVLFAAPRIARGYIVKHSTELIGRKTAIDKIRINYFNGTIRVDGFRLYEKSSSSVFASFERFRVNLSYLPLLRNEIHVASVTLEAPYVQLMQDGNRFNFSDLVKADNTVADTVKKAPLKYVLENIRIRRGYVQYTDIPIDNTIALNKIDLEIPGFTWNSESTNLSVDFNFVDGGSLYSKLELNQSDSTYLLNLKLDSLNLNILQPYLVSSLNISALKGYLSNDLTLKGSMQHVMQLLVQGTNQIEDFSMADTQERTMLAFKKLSVGLDTFLLDKNRIILNDIVLTDPFVLLELVDTVNNWITLVRTAEEAPEDTLVQQADTLSDKGKTHFSFAKLAIEGGKVQYIDKTMRYPFSYAIDDLHLNSAPVKGSPGILSFDLSALLNQTGKLTTHAVFNPEDLADIEFSLAVNHFRMKDLDALFKHYFGYPVTSGVMNFSTDNVIRTKSLQSNNSIYFRKFTLGGRSKDEVPIKVPLKLALGVLSDKDGVIDLKAPVKTKGEEVEIKNLGKIIFKVIGNLFIKAATSPYNLLANMHGTNPDKLREIPLQLFERMPDKKDVGTLDLLADILNKKPGLTVTFYHATDEPSTSDTLAYILAHREYENYLKSNELKNDSDSAFMAFLKETKPSVNTAQAKGAADLCREYVGEEQLKGKLDSLGNLQLDFLRNYLGSETNLDAGRYSISTSTSDTIRPSNSPAAFLIFFGAAGENQY